MDQKKFNDASYKYVRNKDLGLTVLRSTLNTVKISVNHIFTHIVIFNSASS